MATRHHGGSSVHLGHRFRFWPSTRLGWGAVGLAVASVVLIPSWRLLGSAGAVPGMVIGSAGGIAALVAIARRHERAVSVVLSSLPMLFTVAFLLAELIVGHD